MYFLKDHSILTFYNPWPNKNETNDRPKVTGLLFEKFLLYEFNPLSVLKSRDIFIDESLALP